MTIKEENYLKQIIEKCLNYSPKHRIVLERENKGIVLHSNDLNELRFVRYYLHPYLGSTRTTLDSRDMPVYCVNVEHNHWHCLKQHLRDGYKHNKGLQTLNFHYANTTWNIYCIDGHEFIYAEEKGRSSIYALAGTHKNQQSLALMRLVRGEMMSFLNSRGYINFHGASFAYEGNTLIVSGAKRSGKTSLLYYALLRNCLFVSNDKLTFSPCGSEVLGWPFAVSFRKATLQNFEKLTGVEGEQNYDNYKKYWMPPDTSNPQKLKISPKEFCRRLGSPGIQPKGTCKAIFFLDYDRNVTQSILTRLQESEALLYVKQNILSCFTWQRGFKKMESNLSQEQKICELIVKKIPTYLLIQNEETLEDSISQILWSVKYRIS